MKIQFFGVNDNIEIEQYLDDKGMELLFDDIILGKIIVVKS